MSVRVQEYAGEIKCESVGRLEKERILALAWFRRLAVLVASRLVALATDRANARALCALLNIPGPAEESILSNCLPPLQGLPIIMGSSDLSLEIEERLVVNYRNLLVRIHILYASRTGLSPLIQLLCSAHWAPI